MAVTIKDVARETNLAISTISKYMNGGKVRPENQKMIDLAIRKLGYRPNDNARGLRSAKTYTIGVLIDSLGSQYFAKITHLIEKILKKEGYSILVCCHKDNTAAAKKAVEFLVSKQVDGIIIEPVAGEEDYTVPILQNKIPFVAIDRAVGHIKSDRVMSNSTFGAYQATEYLIQNGHKKISIITGTSETNSGLLAAKERYRGYLRAMEDYELTLQDEYIIEGNFKFESGYECMQKLWKLKKRPTAVFVSNYNMCLGAMTAIHNMKISIPEELSFITFDDLEFSVISNPMLNAIRQPMEKMAEKAVELLLRRIDGDYTDYPQNIKLPTELVVRDSVAQYKGTL
ncbi:MAG: LacI family DNA-binding transcriptional regulator [Anaerocolumna sp.]